jgi:hypothetical protein
MTQGFSKDQYRPVEELDKGQSLARYLARDTAYGVEVELDVLELDKSTCPHLAGRLREVLDRAGEINGDHIATLLDWGEEEGRIYLIRERFDGVPLADILGYSDLGCIFPRGDDPGDVAK